MTPVISVVICTYNNADSLALTLGQLSRQEGPEPGSFEVIVVNNNSPDHTDAVVEPYLKPGGSVEFRYLFEPRQGLSHARNTGMKEARGAFILFTDDDADIPAGWVRRYLDVIQSCAPDCVYSKIKIIWDKAVPWWFVPEYTPCFVGLDYGDDLIEVDDPRMEFFGKNFCVRADLLRSMGGFDPALGRVGTKLAAGEETLIFRGLLSAGKKLIYIPDAEVGHRLKAREYLASNILRLNVDAAGSTYHSARRNARKRFMGRPARLIVDATMDLARAFLRVPVHLLSLDKARLYFEYVNVRRDLALITHWVRDA